MINRRIFGSDLPIKIKGILKARQIIAQQSSENTSTGNLPYSPINLTNSIYSVTNPGQTQQFNLEDFLPQNSIN